MSGQISWLDYAKERLAPVVVHQISERRTNINELGVRILEWVSEPED